MTAFRAPLIISLQMQHKTKLDVVDYFKHVSQIFAEVFFFYKKCHPNIAVAIYYHVGVKIQTHKPRWISNIRTIVMQL